MPVVGLLVTKITALHWTPSKLHRWRMNTHPQLVLHRTVNARHGLVAAIKTQLLDIKQRMNKIKQRHIMSNVCVITIIK